MANPLVILHGWSDNKGEALTRFHFLQKRFNLMLFDSRGHGESQGEFVTLGALESLDFDAARQLLRRLRPSWNRSVGLCGISMGAAIAIFAMAKHRDLSCAFIE